MGTLAKEAFLRRTAEGDALPLSGLRLPKALKDALLLYAAAEKKADGPMTLAVIKSAVDIANGIAIDTAWLADTLAGHPRNAALLEALEALVQALEALVAAYRAPPGRTTTGAE